MQYVDISLTIFQAAVIISLLFLAVGMAKPGWLLFWVEKPKRIYLFIPGILLFIGCYFAFSMKTGTPMPIAAIHAVILADALFLIIGMINPAWVFGSEKPDRLWVSIIAVLLFMGLMTLQGMYYGPKNKRQASPTGSLRQQSMPAPTPEPEATK